MREYFKTAFINLILFMAIGGITHLLYYLFDPNYESHNDNMGLAYLSIVILSFVSPLFKKE